MLFDSALLCHKFNIVLWWITSKVSILSCAKRFRFLTVVLINLYAFSIILFFPLWLYLSVCKDFTFIVSLVGNELINLHSGHENNVKETIFFKYSFNFKL